MQFYKKQIFNKNVNRDDEPLTTYKNSPIKNFALTSLVNLQFI